MLNVKVADNILASMRQSFQGVDVIYPDSAQSLLHKAVSQFLNILLSQIIALVIGLFRYH